MTQKHRHWLYQVLLAVIALLVAVGRLSGDHVAPITDLIAALLGIPVAGLASVYSNPSTTRTIDAETFEPK